MLTPSLSVGNAEFGKELIEVARETEKTWQTKNLASKAEFEAVAKARDVEAAQVQGDEKRKTLQREAELQQAVRSQSMLISKR